MKYINLLFLTFLLSSCASAPHFYGDRSIAEETDCKSIVSKFFKQEVTEDELNIVFKERKLLSLGDKFITVNHPQLDWINKTRTSLINRIKSWNKNQYPLFYLDSESNILPLAKSYADLLTKEAAGTLDEEGKKSLESIKDMIGNFEHYQVDLDNLLEERISLQYNIEILKKIKLKDDEVRDVKLTLKQNGVFKNEVVTLRKADRNVGFVINKLQDQIKELDGKVNTFGKIHQRVIEQAILKDMLTIIHRELEYVSKNAAEVTPEIAKALENLEKTLAESSFEPSSYGVYKISNEIFKKEVADLFHLTKPIKQVSNMNQVGIRKYIEKFFGRNTSEKIKETVNTLVDQTKDAATTATEEEMKKEGPLKKIYAKIATFTPYQKFMASTKVGLLGYGAYRFFWFKKDPNPVEVTTGGSTTVEIPDPAHQQQLDATKKVADQNSDGNSKVIEIHLENIIPKK